jgi:hypothetical protein
LNADQFVALLLNSASAITITIECGIRLAVERVGIDTFNNLCEWDQRASGRRSRIEECKDMMIELVMWLWEHCTVIWGS